MPDLKEAEVIRTGFQSAVAHELFSDEKNKALAVALKNRFKALSRMSSSPTTCTFAAYRREASVSKRCRA